MSEIVAPAQVLRQRLGLEYVPLSYPFGSRLPPRAEQALLGNKTIDSAFGIRGFAIRQARVNVLERACIEGEARFEVFGKPLLGVPRPQKQDAVPP